MDISFHYPPELMQLLIDTIPLLCRGKKDVILFFRGAGIPEQYYSDLQARLAIDRTSINKYEIARTILTRINEKGEITLRYRREVLKRATEFDDYSTCWPNDQMKARGYVAQICKVINVKDSFTRINLERTRERQERIATKEKEIEILRKRNMEIERIKADLYSLFSMDDPFKRGKALEAVLNDLFKVYNVSIKESFALSGSSGEGIIEQIDGVVGIDGNTYLVEMKWWAEKIDPGTISQHLVRVYHRGQARGIFISSTGYTPAAIQTCKESLQMAVFVLCTLEEIVKLLEQGADLLDFFRSKINAAQVDKNPYYRPLL